MMTSKLLQAARSVKVKVTVGKGCRSVKVVKVVKGMYEVKQGKASKQGKVMQGTRSRARQG